MRAVWTSTGLVLLAACVSATQPEPDPDPVVDRGDPPEWGTPDAREPSMDRVVLNRLTRKELERSVHALLATEVSLADGLPADGIALGFDNQAQAQSTTLLHLERWESALGAALDDSLRPPITSETLTLQPEDDTWSGGGSDRCKLGTHPTWEDCISLWWNNSQTTLLRVDHPGTYAFRLETCQGYSDVDPELVLLVDSEVQLRWDVSAPCNEGEIVTGSVALEAGLHDLGIAQVSRSGAKMVAVNWVEITGPTEATGEWPPGRSKLYVCDPDASEDPAEQRACAETIMTGFLEEAWRRPTGPEDVTTVMDLYDEAVSGGSDVHHGIRLAMHRALLSPWFLYRVEIPSQANTEALEALSAHELASRVSYLVWGRHPDAELLEAASDGSLLQDEVLASQTRRLLADPRAEAMVENLGRQWLGGRDLAHASPDADHFPAFDEPLREAMQAEMDAAVRRAFLGDVPAHSLWTARDRWVQPPLDAHYGIDVAEPGWVEVPDRPGGGLLMSAGFLTATSTPTRTSPVKRGMWVASHVLCEVPPPPPDGVEAELDEGEDAPSVAEQLAEHRANPACAACHDQIDPIGLALENFDGLGRGRAAYDDGTPIDPAGSLSGVGSFQDAPDLFSKLAEQDRSRRCLVQKTLTYALGRGTTGEDWPAIQEIERHFVERDERFTELVVGVVLSPPFRTHRGEVAQ